jgi:hypothetical protein
MSNFTDRMVAAGVPMTIAIDIEVDLQKDLANAKNAKARLTTHIDSKQSEIDALKAERAAQNAIIDGIRVALNDPNA